MLGVSGRRQDGYLESGDSIVTWCVGHLITMSYPEVYDARYQKWSLDTLPFLPEEFRYEVIPEVKKQFEIVKRLLTREDLYLYRLGARGRVYLPSGRSNGRRAGDEGAKAGLD